MRKDQRKVLYVKYNSGRVELYHKNLSERERLRQQFLGMSCISECSEKIFTPQLAREASASLHPDPWVPKIKTEDKQTHLEDFC